MYVQGRKERLFVQPTDAAPTTGIPYSFVSVATPRLLNADWPLPVPVSHHCLLSVQCDCPRSQDHTVFIFCVQILSLSLSRGVSSLKAVGEMSVGKPDSGLKHLSSPTPSPGADQLSVSNGQTHDLLPTLKSTHC